MRPETASERSPLSPAPDSLERMTIPTISLLERYQGAFMGAALGLTADPSLLALFPWDSLQDIMVTYDRPEYRDHRPIPTSPGQGWPLGQRLLAEILWQGLDCPLLEVGSGPWLKGVVKRWRSLTQAAGLPPSLQSDLLKHQEQALYLLRQRASLREWKQWLHHHSLGIWRQHWDGDLPTADWERTQLEDRDLWVILGVLSRTAGDFPTAIAQGKTLLCSEESMTLGWIGATIGLMRGTGECRATAPLSPQLPLLSSPPLEKTQYLGTQCFTQWAGLPPHNAAGLTPWTIALPQ